MNPPMDKPTNQTELLRLIDQAAAGWTELDLAGLGLTELPEALGRLVTLERLVLGKLDEEKGEWVGNGLVELPGWIGRLENLRVLEARYNKFEFFSQRRSRRSKTFRHSIYSTTKSRRYPKRSHDFTIFKHLI